MPPQPSVPVLGQLLAHLLGRPHQVAVAPGVELLTPEAARASCDDLGLVLADEDLRRPRPGDLVVVPAHGTAVLLEDLALVAPLVGLAPEVGAVRVTGHHPQGQLLTTPADPHRRVRVLHRLGVALGPGHLEVAAVVGGVGLRPHELHDLDGLAQHPDPVRGRREVVAVGPVLLVVPPGTDAPVQPAAGDDVHGGGDLGHQGRVPVAGAADHLAQADGGGGRGQRRDGAPALEDGLVGGHRHVVDVVVDPHRVESQLLGQAGGADGGGPLVLWVLDAGELHLPSLGGEHAEDHQAPSNSRSAQSLTRAR